MAIARLTLQFGYHGIFIFPICWPYPNILFASCFRRYSDFETQIQSFHSRQKSLSQCWQPLLEFNKRIRHCIFVSVLVTRLRNIHAEASANMNDPLVIVARPVWWWLWSHELRGIIVQSRPIFRIFGTVHHDQTDADISGFVLQFRVEACKRSHRSYVRSGQCDPVGNVVIETVQLRRNKGSEEAPDAEVIHCHWPNLQWRNIGCCEPMTAILILRMKDHRIIVWHKLFLFECGLPYRVRRSTSTCPPLFPWR